MYSTQGCKAAKDGTSGVVVLDYGQPAITNPPLPVYGAILIDPHTFVSISDIETAVRGFADGYNDSSCKSIAGGTQHITVAVSINNCKYGSDCFTPGLGYTIALSEDHGRKWALMIGRLKSYVQTIPGLDVAGGIDAEPSWDSEYFETKSWLTGFTAASSSAYYNFGSADTYPCPYFERTPGPGTPTYTPTPSPGVGTPTSTPVPTSSVPNPWSCYDWNADEQYHIAHGISPKQGILLPQTYTSFKTGWWYAVARWSFERYAQVLSFAGQMTDCTAGCTNELDKSQGWRVLWLTLNDDPETKQALPFSTDIGFSSQP